MVPLPPLAEAVSVVLFPEQSVDVEGLTLTVSAAGSVIVTVFVEVQPEPSVTVTVLTPAFKLLITEVVAAVDQR